MKETHRSRPVVRRVRAVAFFLTAILLLLVAVTASSSQDVPTAVLQQLFLNENEINRVLKGEIITKKLDTSDNRDIAVLGAMLLDVPAEATVVAVRDIKKLKDGKEILGLEKFRRFDVEEMKGLTLEDQEVKELGKCRIRDCDSQLPSSWMTALSREQDHAKRAQLLRVLLADYAKDYAARGKKAVLDYDDGKNAVPAQKEFESILEYSPYLKSLSPDFFQYLKEYPENPPSGMEDFLYWSREKFGFKPVINLTHVSIYRWTGPDMSGYIIASRQVFADHYYDASLGLTILINRPPREGKAAGSYLVYINRSRIDMLGGFLRSLKRTITLSRVRSGLGTHMKMMRSRVEEASATRSARKQAIFPPG